MSAMPTNMSWVPSSLLLSLLAILIALLYTTHTSKLTKQGIPHLKSDSRLAKFALSIPLSTKGREIAGDKPYIIQNGNIQELVVTRPEHVRDFYRGDSKHHPKPRNLSMGAYFGRFLGHAVGAQAGERWRVIRKYFDAEFAHSVSAESIPEFTAIIQQWVEQLPSTGTVVQGTDGYAVDIKQATKFLPFRLVAGHLYGEVLTDGVYAQLLDINSLHESIVNDVIAKPHLVSRVWNWLPSSKKRMDCYLGRWERFNMDIILNAREKGIPCRAEQIYRGVGSGKMKESEFLHTMDEILFANVDISSAVLTTLFSNLAVQPDLQQTLRAEIADAKVLGLLKYFSKYESLLNMTVMESIRLRPAFWFSLPECTAEPKKIGPFNIPANTSVVIDAYSINTDPETWGKDATGFRPRRFEGISQVSCRYAFMRFGVGGASGKCLGRNIADLLFKLVVVSILDRYTLAVEEGVESRIQFQGL